MFRFCLFIYGTAHGHAPNYKQELCLFRLKLCVQMWTYKCKLSRNAKRHVSITSLF